MLSVDIYQIYIFTMNHTRAKTGSKNLGRAYRLCNAYYDHTKEEETSLEMPYCSYRGILVATVMDPFS